MSERRRSWIIAGLGAGSLIAALTVGALLSKPDAPRRTQIPKHLTRVESQPAARAPAPIDLGAGAESSADAGRDDDAARPSRCGVSQESGLRRLRLDGFGDYLLYVPKSHDPDHEAPLLVVLFSDFMRGPESWIENTGLLALAEREDVLLLAPYLDELDTSETTRRTVAFVEHTQSQMCVDRSRTYVIGHGGGGRRARELRCALPLSAIATTGSGQKVDEVVCDGAPTPFMRLYGADDERVPMNGGHGCYSGPFMSATQIEAIWAGRNGCKGRPSRWVKRGKNHCRIWTCEAPLVSCELDGGHDWPGAEATVHLPGCKNSAPDFPVLETVWKFFTEHGRDVGELGDRGQ